MFSLLFCLNAHANLPFVKEMVNSVTVYLEGGRPNAIESLKNIIAQIDALNDAALKSAILNSSNAQNESILLLAVQNYSPQSVEMLDVLLDNGAEIPEPGTGQENLLKALLQHLSQQMTSIDRKQLWDISLQKLKLLIKWGIKVNYDSTLFYAVESGSTALVLEILKNGANPNIQRQFGYHPHPQTPLMVAISANNEPMEKLLVQHGASLDSNLPEQNYTHAEYKKDLLAYRFKKGLTMLRDNIRAGLGTVMISFFRCGEILRGK